MSMRTRIAQLRKRAKLTKAELARKAKLSRAYVTQLEAGTRERISLDVAERLAKALDVNVTDLLKGR